MKLINLFVGLLCVSLTEMIAATVDTNTEKASSIAQQKFSKLVEAMPLDESHPAILAASKISDPSVQSGILAFCNTFQKDLNIIIGWLVHQVPSPEDILVNWKNCSVQERPILQAGKLLKHEVIKLENLKEYLETLWQGSPLVVADDYHSVSIKIRKEEEQVVTDFYDPYEPFDNGSFLEISIRGIIDSVYYSEEKGVLPEWRAHYTKHQRLTAFGECGLYASVYRSFLLKGREPHEVPEDEVLSNVAVLKDIIRDQNPDYFKRYDSLYQFIFDSDFAALLLEEVKKLPKTWGKEPEL
ncbi:MAG: hypothetical protein WCJ92_05670 [Alphaproteobacteria bacterium]